MSFLDQIGQLSVLWPRMLWLLVPVPILILLYLRASARQRAALGRLTGLSALAASSGFASRLRRTLPPLLFVGKVVSHKSRTWFKEERKGGK
jgi:Ca-activated chloride channel family protein